MEQNHENYDQALQSIATALGRKASEIRSAIERYFAYITGIIPKAPGPIQRITTEIASEPSEGASPFIGKSVALKVDGWKPLEVGLRKEPQRNFERELVYRTVVAVRNMGKHNGRKYTKPRIPLVR